jgi:outer membrane protein assembly factor BamA
VNTELWRVPSSNNYQRIPRSIFRFKLFSSAKFNAKKYDEDKEKVLNYYNSVGFRDASIAADTQY